MIEENRGHGKAMPLLSHLSELRWRLIASLLTILVFFAISLFFSSSIINFLKEPLLACLPETPQNLHFTGPLDVFLTSIKSSFLAALVLACPVWIYHFWRFIEPALYDNEKKYIFPFIFVSILLFLFGISFSYFFILPISLEFLIKLGLEVSTPMITIKDYFSLLSIMIFGFGFIFEAPLILVLLSFLGFVDHRQLSSVRRYVCVACFIVAAIFTPPDPLSQVGMAIPLYIMYEISIMIIKLINKKAQNT